MAAKAQSSEQTIAHVRLQPERAAKYHTENEKAVRAPSGRTYYFEGEGMDDGDPSEWLPVDVEHEEDLEMFQSYDAFEVRRG